MEYADEKVNNFMKIIAYSIHGCKLPDLSRKDWEEVFEIAERQNLLPLVYEAAMHDTSLEKDRSFRENLYVALVNAADQDAKTEAFLRLYKCFIDAGCLPIVVKGIICRRLYGQKGSFRLSGDEDIIINIDEFDTVNNVLNQQGYQIVIDEEDDLSKYDKDAFFEKLKEVKELSFYNSHDDLNVEVHINPFGVRNQVNRDMNKLFEDAASRCIFENINDVSIRTYSYTDHLLFLILHAFKHFIYNGFGIRMALDISMFLEKYYEECDLNYIRNKLKAVNAEKFFYDIIYISDNYLGFDFSSYGCSYPNELIGDMINSGTFGNEKEGSDLSAVFTTAAIKNSEKPSFGNNRFGAFFRMAFPGKNWLYSVDPRAKNNPLRAFRVYYQRIVKGLKYIKCHNNSLLRSTLDDANNRVELLKKYGIV